MDRPPTENYRCEAQPKSPESGIFTGRFFRSKLLLLDVRIGTPPKPLRSVGFIETGSRGATRHPVRPACSRPTSHIRLFLRWRCNRYHPTNAASAIHLRFRGRSFRCIRLRSLPIARDCTTGIWDSQNSRNCRRTDTFLGRAQPCLQLAGEHEDGFVVPRQSTHLEPRCVHSHRSRRMQSRRSRCETSRNGS
jgi:hypothetical protein